MSCVLSQEIGSKIPARRVDFHCQGDEPPSILRLMAESSGHFDETDRRIIERLRDNGRAGVALIARALGLSRTTVQSRIERLERRGLIAGYTVRLSEAHERGLIRAYVMLTVAPKRSAAVVAAIRGMASVRRLVSVSGPFDLIAEAACASAAEMDALIDALGQLEGVERTTSSIVLSSKVDR